MSIESGTSPLAETPAAQKLKLRAEILTDPRPIQRLGVVQTSLTNERINPNPEEDQTIQKYASLYDDFDPEESIYPDKYYTKHSVIEEDVYKGHLSLPDNALHQNMQQLLFVYSIPNQEGVAEDKRKVLLAWIGRPPDFPQNKNGVEISKNVVFIVAEVGFLKDKFKALNAQRIQQALPDLAEAQGLTQEKLLEELTEAAERGDDLQTVKDKLATLKEAPQDLSDAPLKEAVAERQFSPEVTIYRNQFGDKIGWLSGDAMKKKSDRVTLYLQAYNNNPDLKEKFEPKTSAFEIFPGFLASADVLPNDPLGQRFLGLFTPKTENFNETELVDFTAALRSYIKNPPGEVHLNAQWVEQWEKWMEDKEEKTDSEAALARAKKIEADQAIEEGRPPAGLLDMMGVDSVEDIIKQAENNPKS